MMTQDETFVSRANEAKIDRLHRAWALVNPRNHVAGLVERGKLPASAMSHPSASWKAPIAELLTDEALAAADVTIEDVSAAVVFFTATVAKVTRERIGGIGGEKYDPAKPGYFVRAAGYRAGPAGDH